MYIYAYKRCSFQTLVANKLSSYLNCNDVIVWFSNNKSCILYKITRRFVSYQRLRISIAHSTTVCLFITAASQMEHIHVPPLNFVLWQYTVDAIKDWKQYYITLNKKNCFFWRYFVKVAPYLKISCEKTYDWEKIEYKL